MHICARQKMIKWLTYDLESTFLRRGFKRPDTLVLEIALYGKEVPEKKNPIAFQKLVNPLQKYDTGEDVIESLESAGQHVERSVNFWVKLLIEKHMLDSSTRRLDRFGKADALAALFKKKPDAFVTPAVALSEAIEFGAEHYWVAHNGRSFDEKIVRGTCARHNITIENITFTDSLVMFKKYFPDQPSYSQPILYKTFFPGQKYFAHHAEEDARALHKMMTHALQTHALADLLRDGHAKASPRKRPSRRRTKKAPDSDLYDIQFVGPTSVAEFAKQGITSKALLKAFIDAHDAEQFQKQFSRVYRYKQLSAKLYSGEITL